MVVRAGVEKMAQEYSNATVGGGVEDMYGEDRATEEQLVTPWTFSVARPVSITYLSLRFDTLNMLSNSDNIIVCSQWI